MKDTEQTPFDNTRELENWLLEAADNPTTPLTHADFDAIRERVRSRTNARSQR
jgi:hypothetical protein